jgi:hypothetical protein
MSSLEAAMSKHHLVQMNVSEKTLHKVQRIQTLGDLPNRTTAIKLAVDVIDVLATTLHKGGKIVIVNADGNEQELLVPGFSKDYENE